MKRGLVAGFLVIVLVGLAAAAWAGEEKKGVRVGALKCNEAAGWGFVFMSTTDLKCVFSPAEKGAKSERYTGKIKKFGVDVGYHGAAVLLWGVMSMSEKVTPGALAGHYGGVTGEAAWAAGLGANVIAGGSKKGFALQPIAIEGVAGVNVAAGVVELELKKAK
jgi:hypothetical protein